MGGRAEAGRASGAGAAPPERVTAGSVLEVRYANDSVVLLEEGIGEVATARFEETVMHPVGNRVSLSDPARDFSLLLEPVEPPADWASAPTPPAHEPGMKVCPQCAEEVKAAALICRYCRYEFGPLTPAGLPGN